MQLFCCFYNKKQLQPLETTDIIETIRHTPPDILERTTNDVSKSVDMLKLRLSRGQVNITDDHNEHFEQLKNDLMRVIAESSKQIVDVIHNKENAHMIITDLEQQVSRLSLEKENLQKEYAMFLTGNASH